MRRIRAIRSLPPIARRSHRLTHLLGTVVLYWMGAYGLLHLLAPHAARAISGSVAQLMLVLGAPYLLFGAYWVWLLRWGPPARLRRRLGEARFCICGRCGHNLRGLAVRGRCPECGDAYDANRLRRYWRRWARPPLRADPALHYGRHNPWPARIIAIPAMLIMLLVFDSAFGWSLAILVIGVPLIGWVAMLLWAYENLESLKRRAHVAELVDLTDGRICSRCGWDLGDHDETGQCPACRKAYDHASLRIHWRHECPPHWDLEMKGVEPAITTVTAAAEATP